MTPLVSVFFVATFCAVTQVTSGVPSASNRQHIVDVHNKHRTNEPARPPIPGMTYDLTLEREAQNWVKDCNFSHQKGKSWGENLAIATNWGDTNNVITGMIDNWVAEKKFNTGGTFEECCSTKATSCCHYTQVIWAKSVKVGCGMKVCHNMAIGAKSYDNMLYLACYYSARGNFAVNNNWRPYPK